MHLTIFLLPNNLNQIVSHPKLFSRVFALEQYPKYQRNSSNFIIQNICNKWQFIFLANQPIQIQSYQIIMTLNLLRPYLEPLVAQFMEYEANQTMDADDTHLITQLKVLQTKLTVKDALLSVLSSSQLNKLINAMKIGIPIEQIMFKFEDRPGQNRLLFGQISDANDENNMLKSNKQAYQNQLNQTESRKIILQKIKKLNQKLNQLKKTLLALETYKGSQFLLYIKPDETYSENTIDRFFSFQWCHYQKIHYNQNLNLSCQNNLKIFLAYLLKLNQISAYAAEKCLQLVSLLQNPQKRQSIQSKQTEKKSLLTSMIRQNQKKKCEQTVCQNKKQTRNHHSLLISIEKNFGRTHPQLKPMRDSTCSFCVIY